MSSSLLKEVTMANGAVLRCRAVPPYAQAAVRSQLPSPPYPKVKVKSAAGGEEEHHALPGTQEYEDYRKAQDQYRMELGAALAEFNLNYGVDSWTLPGEDGETWHDMPPAGWVVPQGMILYGIKTATDPAGYRAQFIQHELITTDMDNEIVDAVLTPAQPLTKKEILAALDPFGLDERVDLLIILQAAPHL